MHAFFFPAQSSMIPELVPSQTLRQANAINQLASQVVLAGAPALGFLIAGVGVAGGFSVDATSFLVSAAFLLLIRPPAAHRGTPAHLLQLRTDRAYMGRVMAIMLFGIYGLYPFSYGLAGWASETVGVRALFSVGGSLIVLAGLLGLGSAPMRSLE